MSFYKALECSQQTNTTKKGRKAEQTQLLTNTGSSSSSGRFSEIGSRAKWPNSNRYFVKSKTENHNTCICSYFSDLHPFFWWKRREKWQEPVQGGPQLPSPVPALTFPREDDNTEATQNSLQEPTVSFAWNFGSGCLRKICPQFSNSHLVQPTNSVIFSQADSVFRLTEQFAHDGFLVRLFPSGRGEAPILEAFYNQNMRTLAFQWAETDLSWPELETTGELWQAKL